jgi:hypothetical protein
MSDTSSSHGGEQTNYRLLGCNAVHSSRERVRLETEHSPGMLVIYLYCVISQTLVASVTTTFII